MDESVSSSQTHTLRQLAGIQRLTQLLYASPQRICQLPLNLPHHHLHYGASGAYTYQVGERMPAITADSRQTSQEAMV